MHQHRFSNDRRPRRVLITLTVGVAAAALLVMAAAPASSEPAASQALAAPPPGHTQRIGGDHDASIERTPRGFRAGASEITTPLPEGYPDPSPPGAIDLKTYPSVRRAEVSSDVNADLGMNVAFWPLFQHIQRHDIAMTSPVEMDYRGMTARLSDDAADVPNQEPERLEWTMSFLYRTPDLNDTGEEGVVRIVDTAPVTVVAIAYRGAYTTTNVAAHAAELAAFIEAHPQLEPAGEPRALFYNGPEKRSRDKWAEVQIPVRVIAPEQR
ncbi:MAG: hypothetical protein EA379_11295 [Phycisphaerales bacterium]|nr:MAG: hypothetical protein EA379_11295 [Phycisphaerales bacterium]